MLDLVQPLAAGGQRVGLGGEARRDEPGRKGTLQHDALSKVGQRQLQLRRACFFGRMVLVMTGRPPAVVASPGPSENPHGGSGRLREFRALPDLCPGIVSAGLGDWTFLSSK